MEFFGTFFTHVQTCDVTCVQSATEWTAAVHTLHMCDEIRVHSTCSEARLDKERDENAADTTAKRKMPQKMNPIFRAQEFGHVTIPCK